jgi:hypothetical protein
MKTLIDWLFDGNHPLRSALACWVFALANIYEATRIDSLNGFAYIVSSFCAAAGVLGFLSFLIISIGRYFTRTDG